MPYFYYKTNKELKSMHMPKLKYLRIFCRFTYFFYCTLTKKREREREREARIKYP